jgi:hypothetical protein
MSYRPITDVWFLARAALKPHANGTKRKYYGAYLGGFPERARILIGAKMSDPVLHVCGGMARHYKHGRAFGPYDRTLDLDPNCEPDYCQDAREPFPLDLSTETGNSLWAGILIDPPYSTDDAEHYAPGSLVYPRPNVLIKNALAVLPIGGKVGMIHYILPGEPPNAKFVAAVGVMCGFNNRIRCFSVFEKLSEAAPGKKTVGKQRN